MKTRADELLELDRKLRGCDIPTLRILVGSFRYRTAKPEPDVIELAKNILAEKEKAALGPKEWEA